MMNAGAGEPMFIGNDRGLLEIETTYNCDRLNIAKENGSVCLITPIVRNPQLELHSLLLRNRENGEFVSVPSRAFHAQYTRFLEYPDSQWEKIQKVSGYGRTRDQSQNWGAYIFPKSLKIGTEVYIPDVIEDIVATEFWYTVWPAGDAIATWDGQELKIDHSVYDKLHLIG